MRLVLPLLVLLAASPPAATATVSSSAAAAGPELRGPTILLYSGETEARLNFGTAERIRGLRVRFSDQGSFAVKALGRRGSAYRYQAAVRSRRPLRIGARYTIRVVAPDGATVTRRVVLTQRL